MTVFLNHAGASPCSNATLQRVLKHLTLEQSEGGYAAEGAIRDELNQVYESIATLISATNKDTVAIVESATVAWTRIFYAVAEYVLARPEPRNQSTCENIILISQVEYAANVVAICQWCRRHPGWSVLMIPSREDGSVDAQALNGMLKGVYVLEQNRQLADKSSDLSTSTTTTTTSLDPAAIAMICVTQIPTNSGVCNPVEEIGRQIQEYNHANHPKKEIFYLVDACQAVGQAKINVQTMQCHGLVGTGRKYLRGPRGTGFLYLAESWLHRSDFWPSHIDHAGVPVKSFLPISTEDITNSASSIVVSSCSLHHRLVLAPLPTARRFEFWESNVAAKLGLGVAVREYLEHGSDWIATTIQARAQELMKHLQEMPGIRLYRPTIVVSSGIVTFSTADSSHKAEIEVVKELLQEHDCELSITPSTSTPMEMNEAPSNLIRASVSYTTTTQDIQHFISALRLVLQN